MFIHLYILFTFASNKSSSLVDQRQIVKFHGPNLKTCATKNSTGGGKGEGLNGISMKFMQKYSLCANNTKWPLYIDISPNHSCLSIK